MFPDSRAGRCKGVGPLHLPSLCKRGPSTHRWRCAGRPRCFRRFSVDADTRRLTQAAAAVTRGSGLEGLDLTNDELLHAQHLLSVGFPGGLASSPEGEGVGTVSRVVHVSRVLVKDRGLRSIWATGTTPATAPVTSRTVPTRITIAPRWCAAPKSKRESQRSVSR